MSKILYVEDADEGQRTALLANRIEELSGKDKRYLTQYLRIGQMLLNDIMEYLVTGEDVEGVISIEELRDKVMTGLYIVSENGKGTKGLEKAALLEKLQKINKLSKLE